MQASSEHCGHVPHLCCLLWLSHASPCLWETISRELINRLTLCNVCGIQIHTLQNQVITYLYTLACTLVLVLYVSAARILNITRFCPNYPKWDATSNSLSKDISRMTPLLHDLLAALPCYDWLYCVFSQGTTLKFRWCCIHVINFSEFTKVQMILTV